MDEKIIRPYVLRVGDPPRVYGLHGDQGMLLRWVWSPSHGVAIDMCVGPPGAEVLSLLVWS